MTQLAPAYPALGNLLKRSVRKCGVIIKGVTQCHATSLYACMSLQYIMQTWRWTGLHDTEPCAEHHARLISCEDRSGNRLNCGGAGIPPITKTRAILHYCRSRTTKIKLYSGNPLPHHR